MRMVQRTNLSHWNSTVHVVAACANHGNLTCRILSNEIRIKFFWLKLHINETRNCHNRVLKPILGCCHFGDANDRIFSISVTSDIFD